MSEQLNPNQFTKEEKDKLKALAEKVEDMGPLRLERVKRNRTPEDIGSARTPAVAEANQIVALDSYARRHRASQQQITTEVPARMPKLTFERFRKLANTALAVSASVGIIAEIISLFIFGAAAGSALPAVGFISIVSGIVATAIAAQTTRPKPKH
jgi:hypothetical protein